MKHTTIGLRLLLVLAVLLLGAACGGGSGDGDTGGNGGAGGGADNGPDNGSGDHPAYTLVTKEFSFTPDSLTISADSDVTVMVDNSGGVVEHDFTLDEADVKVHADPGKTAEGHFSVPAGTYTFYCSIPGHRQSGMEGTLTAE